MNNVRFNRKLPLYQLDWPSFLIFTSCFALGGYLAVYGQQYDWFDDRRVVLASILMFVFVLCFIVRQLSAKRPYINLKVFKIRNFLIGILLLFVLYLARGAFGVTTSFMGNVLGLDPIHIGYMMVYNVSAIVVAVIISSRMVLAKKPLRLVFFYGFSLLMAFHIYMCFIFTTQVDSVSLILPVVLQGLGVGMVMAPIILFVVSSSPAKYGSTGSAIGIMVRFSGFCSSIAVTNYFQVYSQNNHLNRFQEKLSALDPQALERLGVLRQSMLSKGVSPEAALKIANSLLAKNLATQAQARYALDYYHLIIWMLFGVLLAIILLPSINRTVIHLRSKQAPSSY
jgi:DHA2 family multidrug resistance protein